MTNLFDELRIAMHNVWRRRWLALAIAWGVCLVGWLAVAMVPNSYESRARIFVQLDDVLAEQIGIGTGDRRRDIERVRQTLTSAVNLEKVVRATRLGDAVSSPRDMERVVLALAEDVKVVSQQDNLFEITAQSGAGDLSDVENARLAHDIVQKMIDIFREENLSGGRGEMTDTLAFVDQQLAERQKELEAAEQKRLAFEARNAELIPGVGSLTQRLEGSRAELRGIEADLMAAQSALAAINGQLAGTPPTIAVPGAAGGARGALLQAQADLSAMRARGLTDSHPDVIAQRNQVEGLQRQAASEGSRGPAGAPNPAYSSLQAIKAEREAGLVGLQSRRASLQAEIAATGARQYDEPAVAAEAARINRDYDVLRQQYDKLLRDREELRLRGQVETERDAIRFQVIDPPTTPRAPVAPNRPLLLLGVLIVGLAAGAGGAFAVMQLRSTYSTVGALERASGLPVLGSVSHTLTNAGRELRARQMKWFAGASAALVGVFAVLQAIEFVQRGLVA